MPHMSISSAASSKWKPTGNCHSCQKRRNAPASVIAAMKKAPRYSGALGARTIGLVAAASGAAARFHLGILSAERVAAGAGAFGVRVREGEALAHQPIDVVDLRAVEDA